MKIQAPSSPALLQRFQWILDPVRYLEQSHAEHPDFFLADGLGFSNYKIVITSHPQALQYILTNDRKQFVSPGETNRMLEPLIGSESVIMLEGDRHRRRRQLVMPSFHGERMQTYGELISRLAEKSLSQMAIGQTFMARRVTQQISLNVIFEVVFGLNQGERAEQIRHLLTEAADLFSSPLTSALLFLKWLQKDLGAWSPWGRFLRLRQQLDALLYAEIADRRAHPDPDRTDILSLMMQSHDEAGQPMTDQELRDELMTLLMAGHETTASAMSWGLYWIHRLPEVKAKLLQELDSLPDAANPLEVARLPYLTAVCQETLRRSPVAMLTFPRIAQEPVEIMGYHFEPGTVMMGCIYLTHQREDLYPNPEEFRPERFLERKYSPYEFIPFGSGVRRCIGEALAQYELKLSLATILSHYQLALADDKAEVPQRRGVTLTPARGVRMKLVGQRQVDRASSMRSNPQPSYTG